jgi:ParB family chromosome partitioning protein
MALIENIQREDLNPLEEAQALHRLSNDFQLTHQELAALVGKSRATVTNLLRLLALADEVKRLLENGDLEMGHARALLSLDAARQREAARLIVAKGLSVRQTEDLVRSLTDNAGNHRGKKLPAAQVQPDIQRLEENLSERLGAAVSIQHRQSGKGSLVIRYNTLDELDGILAHLQ